MDNSTQTNPIDPESESFLALLSEQERVKTQRIPGVRTVLVVLSSRAMPFDRESLRQKILLAYPDAAVFFRTTRGKSVGPAAPQNVDLLIDFTGPGQKQGWFYAKSLRRIARVAIGRNAGLFRARIYDRLYDEKAKAAQLPQDMFDRERMVQKEVLSLAGVAMAPMGDILPDRGKTIALDLPRLART